MVDLQYLLVRRWLQPILPTVIPVVPRRGLGLVVITLPLLSATSPVPGLDREPATPSKVHH